MTYFFDNTFPPQLSKIMAILGVDARHLQDQFPPDTKDVDYLPVIGAHGWVLITGDRNISKKPAERLALEQANIISVFMAKGYTSKLIFDQVSLFIRWWPEIERNVRRVSAGTQLEVTVNGKIEML